MRQRQVWLVWLCSIASISAQPLSRGDVFVGQFEMGGSSVDGLFELRVHSPVSGQATWLSEALGAHPGWMASCHEQMGDSYNCAGAALEKPVFGYLNYTTLGVCQESSGQCSGPPDKQPGTGCMQYGCWSPACGCNVGTGEGCWGQDMREAIALIQRGMGIGEAQVAECTFNRKIHFAQLAGARAAIVFNNRDYGAIYMAASDDDYNNVSIPAVFVTRQAGLHLFEMIQQAHPLPLDASLTNMTEHSLRVTVTDVTTRAPTPSPQGAPAVPPQRQWIEAQVEMRVNVGLYIDSDGVPSQGVFAKYRVHGYTDRVTHSAGAGSLPVITDHLSLFPSCTSAQGSGGSSVCTVDDVAWITPFPRWYRTRAMGLQGLLLGGVADSNDDTGFAF